MRRSIILPAALTFFLALPVFRIITEPEAYIAESTRQYQEIAVSSVNIKQTEPSTQKQYPDLRSIFFDNKNDTFWLGKANPAQANVIIFNFSRKSEVSKIFLDFAPHRAAIDFSIDTSSNSGWKSLLNIRQNNRSSVTLYLPKYSPPSSSIRLTITKTQDPDALQQISEARFYSSEDLNPLSTLIRLIFVHPRTLPAYFYYVILLSGIVILIGSLVVEPFKNHFQEHELPVITFSGGIFLLSLFGLFLLRIPKNELTRDISLVILIGLSTVALRRKFVYRLKLKSHLTLITLLFTLFVIIFYFFFDKEQFQQSSLFDKYYDDTPTYSIPYSSFEQDYETPYGAAKVLNYGFSQETPEYQRLMGVNLVSDRTPLLPLFAIPFLRIFGDRFFIFETASIAFLIPFLPAVFLLVKKLFDQRIAILSILFLAINHFLTYVIHFSQLKPAAAAFTSLFFYFLIKFRQERKPSDLFSAGLMVSLAIATHPSTIIYFLSGLLYLASDLHSWVSNKKLVIICFTIPTVIILSWMGWGAWENQTNLLSEHFGFQTQAADKYTPEAFRAKPGLNFENRWYNLLGLFLTNPRPGPGRSFGFFRLTLIATLTISLFPFALLGTFRYFRKNWREIFFFIIMVITLTLFPANSFYVQLGVIWYLVGVIPLLIALGCNFLYRISRHLLFLVFLGSLTEPLYVTWILYHFDIADGLIRYLKEDHLGAYAAIIFFLVWYTTIILIFYRELFLADSVDVSRQKIRKH